jgi:hypothetical protein
LGFIKNTSTDPTLFRSVAYIINLDSNDRYVSFLKKPTMIANDTNEADEVDEVDNESSEQKNDEDFKYKGLMLYQPPSLMSPNITLTKFGNFMLCKYYRISYNYYLQ